MVIKRKLRQCLLLALALCAVVGILATHAEAATITSNGTGGGTWATGSTWVGGVAPIATDNAVIAGGDTVTLGADAQIVDLTISGTLDASTYTLTVTGDWDSSGGTFNYGTSTVDLTGTGNLNTSSAFYNLTMAAAGATTTLQSNVTVRQVCTLGTGILTGQYRLVLLYTSSATSPLVNNGATVSIDTLRYFAAGTSWFPTKTVLGGTYTLTTGLFLTSEWSGNTFNLDADLTVINGTVNLQPYIGDSTFNTQNNNITAAGFSFAGTGGGTANFGSSTIDLGTSGLDIANNAGSHTLNLNSAQITSEGNWELVDGTGSITQNPGTSTVTFDGTGPQSITSNGSAFNTIEITNPSGTVTFLDDLTATNFTSNTGSADMKFNAGNTYTITNFTINGLPGSLINLDSTNPTHNPADRWNLNVSGTHSVSFTEVSDSDASGGNTINCQLLLFCIEPNDNNVNWNFLAPVPVPVPTMSQWGMIIFMLLAGVGSIYYIRRQRTV